MENKTKFVLKEFLRFICYALITLVLLLAMFGITHIDMARFGTIQEFSLTEILQESILLFCTGIFIFIARRYKRQGLWLVAGFLCCMFIRELDVLFDMIFHGAWKYFALPCAVFFIFLACRNGLTPVIDDLEHLMKKKNYPFLLMALILILIVSRILGSLTLVKLIAVSYDQDYQYLIKNFMEESSELVGYLILSVCTCCYYFEYRKEGKENSAE